jgi:uncharacterized protein
MRTLLKNHLKELITPNGVVLAFSGGVDSALLLCLLSKIKEETSFNLYPVMIKTSFLPESDYLEAQKICQELNEKLYTIDFSPFDIKELEFNPTNRCYICKKAMFSKLLDFAHNKNITTVLDGSNSDDKKVYRPGLKAIEELKIISPLATLGINKANVRSLAKEFNLSCAQRPSTPCLATRFDYETKLDAKMLEKVKLGEEIIKAYLPKNADLRLRVDKKSCRIETNLEYFTTIMQNKKELTTKLKELEFEYISLDLEGFRSGSYDKKLS